jgi:hypothetical protein
VQAGETKPVARGLGSDSLANAIPLDLGVGDLDKVIWLGFSDGYLESNQGDWGDVPYCILVVFSTHVNVYAFT